MRTLRVGERVLARDGDRLGEVERLVVDERAHRVTHVLVRGRLVELDRLRDAGPGGLASDLDRAALERLPRARPELVESPPRHWRAPAGHALEHFLSIANAIIGQVPYVPPVEVELDLGAIHEIAGGSPVWSGKERLGEVDRVLTDEQGRIQRLVLGRGLLEHRVAIPIERVTEVVGTNVHVDLSPDEARALPPYEDD